MAGGDHGNHSHKTAQIRARVVELRDQGLSFRDIAAEVGLSLSTTWYHYEKAMRAIPAPMVAAHAEAVAARREEQLRRIDMEREVVTDILAKARRTVVTAAGKVVEDVEDDASVLAAVDRLVKLDDQESKLLGLNTKTQVDHTGEVTYRVLGVDPGALA